MTTTSILIVEDDPLIRRLLGAAFAREPLHVELAADGVEAMQRLDTLRPAVVLLDLMMPRMSGFEVLDRLRARPDPPVVFVISAYTDAATARLDPRLVHAIFRKPFDLERLVDVVRDTALLWDGVRRSFDDEQRDRDGLRP